VTSVVTEVIDLNEVEQKRILTTMECVREKMSTQIDVSQMAELCTVYWNKVRFLRVYNKKQYDSILRTIDISDITTTIQVIIINLTMVAIYLLEDFLIRNVRRPLSTLH